MNSAQLCEEIKSLIQEILTAHNEKENFTDTSEAKARLQITGQIYKIIKL